MSTENRLNVTCVLKRGNTFNLSTQIGAALMERFEGAFQMTYRGGGVAISSSTSSRVAKKLKNKLLVVDKNMKKPTKKDLVYLDDSPDYCERNQT